VDSLSIRNPEPAQLKVAKQLTQKGLQPRKLLLVSCGPGGSREAATQLLVSEEFRGLLGHVKDLTLYDGKRLTQEMLQVRHLSSGHCSSSSQCKAWPLQRSRGNPD
jgi:hypothetical protein